MAQASTMEPNNVKKAWELVVLDLLDPLPVSEDGYKYVCTFVDYYTKFPEFFSLKDESAFEISKCIRSFIHRWGRPGRIVTNRGHEFCAEINDQLCKAYGIKSIITSEYHPQTNGLVVRTKQTFKTRLTKVSNKAMSDWSKYVEDIAYTIRTQKQKSTGFTPFHLLFGSEHRPIDQDEGELEGLSDESCCFEELVTFPTAEEVSSAYQENVCKHKKLNDQRDKNVAAAQQKQKAKKGVRTKGVARGGAMAKPN